MSPRYGFQSPGGNIADTLLALREQKRVEARQAMLDELEKQRTTSSLETDKSQREAAAQQISHAKQQMELEQLGVMRSGLEPGDEPANPALFNKYELLTKPKYKETPFTPPQLPPDQESKMHEDSDQLRKLGNFTPEQIKASENDFANLKSGNNVPLGEERVTPNVFPIPGVGQNVKPSIAPGGRYTGTQQQRDEAADEAAAAEVARVWADPNASKTTKDAALISLETRRGRMPAGGYAALIKSLEPPKKRVLIDAEHPDKAKYLTVDGNQIDENTDVTVIPRPPRELRAPVDRPQYIMEAPPSAGPGIAGKPIYATNSGPTYWDDNGVAKPYRGPAGVKPTATTQKPSIIPEKLSNDLANAKQKLGITKGSWWSPDGAEGEIGRVNVLAQAMIAHAKSPEVRLLATRVLRDKSIEGFPSEYIADDLAEAKGLSAEEKVELRDILTQVRGI